MTREEAEKTLALEPGFFSDGELGYLWAVSRGGKHYVSCDYAGITDTACRQMMAENDEFRTAISRIRAAVILRLTGKLLDSDDWRSAAKYLELFPAANETDRRVEYDPERFVKSFAKANPEGAAALLSECLADMGVVRQ